MAEMRAAVPSTYHSLLPSGTPPLLPIPLHVPSTSRRAEIPVSDMPPRKRLLLTVPRPGCEEDDDRLRDGQHEGQLPVVRAEIEVLRRERLAYEQENIQIHEALAGSEAYSRTLEKKMAPKQTTRSIADQETTNTTSVTNAQLQAMIDQGITAALEARDALKSTNGDDSHNSGTGNCAVENQVKFATCTLHSIALTWWNAHVKTVGHDAAYASKRKFENTSRSTQNQQQQQPNKRQNTGRVYTAASGERKEYAGTLPLYNKCKFYHNGQCIIKCANCKRVGHLTQDCRSPTAINNHMNPTCYECGNQGHYRSDCPELKNQDHGNQA
nr:hypothetical protein [Tanacetum cinerariifolium]